MCYQRIYRASPDPHSSKNQDNTQHQNIRPCYACSINAQGERPYIPVNSSPAIKKPIRSNIGAMGKRRWKTDS